MSMDTMDYYHTMDEQAYGLPPGTLSRDQRTTITNRQCCDQILVTSSPCDHHHCELRVHRCSDNNDNRNSSSANTTTCNTRIHIRRKYFPKFSEVVFWIALICSMQVVCKAAPTRKSTSNSRVTRSTPMWINPCGIENPNDIMPGDSDVPSVSDHELLSQIVLQAKTALSAAARWKDDYVKDVFNVDYDEHHTAWINSHYDWLPNKDTISKSLGESLPAGYFDSIKDLNITLVNTYENLQKFAVGLEAVANDHKTTNSNFKELFSLAEYNLRALLCEIQVALIERSATRKPDVGRDIMDNEYRSLSGSARDLRDWIVYRDYMNMLEYTIEVFDFFKDNTESEKKYF